MTIERKVVHMRINVRGVLNWGKRDMARIMGTRTGDEARDLLLDELQRGHAVIPIGEPCEGFDYSGGGCPGHPSPIAPEARQ
jgi:hypothetical protein